MTDYPSLQRGCRQIPALGLSPQRPCFCKTHLPCPEMICYHVQQEFPKFTSCFKQKFTLGCDARGSRSLLKDPVGPAFSCTMRLQKKDSIAEMFGFHSTKLMLDTHARVVTFLQGAVQTSGLPEYYLTSVTPVEPGALLSLGTNE